MTRADSLLSELVLALENERLSRELDVEKHPERSQRIAEAVARRANAERVASEYLHAKHGRLL